MKLLSKEDLEAHAVVDKGHAPAATEAFNAEGTIEITPEFRNFHQHNDMFSRGLWDRKFANKMTMRFYKSFVKPTERMRDEEGFEQEDFAFRNGPWVVTEMLAEMKKGEDRREGFTDDFSPHVPPRTEPVVIGSSSIAAKKVKKVARIYGADLVGITKYDPRWTYASKFSGRKQIAKPIDIPAEVTNVIVVGKAMEHELVRMSPTATASASAAAGYAEDAVTLLALAQYIRSLGYIAITNQNDTNLAVPYALQAGLGEYGRNGLVITKKYGPRVRFGRILTNMPLDHDKAISFGVAKTCDVCRRCANNCPPQAISHGAPSTYAYNRSNVPGIKKWTTDGEKCFKFWVLKGSDCANCIRTCPYNKDFSKWWARAIRFALGTPFRKLALRFDDTLRLHDQVRPSSWWQDRPGAPAIMARAKDHAPIPELEAHQERVKAIRDKKKAAVATE